MAGSLEGARGLLRSPQLGCHGPSTCSAQPAAAAAAVPPPAVGGSGHSQHRVSKGCMCGEHVRRGGPRCMTWVCSAWEARQVPGAHAESQNTVNAGRVLGSGRCIKAHLLLPCLACPVRLDPDLERQVIVRCHPGAACCTRRKPSLCLWAGASACSPGAGLVHAATPCNT